jgi:hypothetical protein
MTTGDYFGFWILDSGLKSKDALQEASRDAQIIGRCRTVKNPRMVIVRCIAILLVGVSAGCTGSGTVQFASLDMTRVDPPPARVQTVQFGRVSWWTDEVDGTLRIAFEKDAPSLLGEIGRVIVQLSLRLEKLPAGPSREYKLGPSELRGRVRVGATETRLASASGVAVIDRVSESVLRLIATRRTMQLLGGWGTGARLLVLGEFRAVREEGVGARIYEETESNDFVRPAIPAASQPASR